MYWFKLLCDCVVLRLSLRPFIIYWHLMIPKHLSAVFVLTFYKTFHSKCCFNKHNRFCRNHCTINVFDTFLPCRREHLSYRESLLFWQLYFFLNYEPPSLERYKHFPRQHCGPQPLSLKPEPLEGTTKFATFNQLSRRHCPGLSKAGITLHYKFLQGNNFVQSIVIVHTEVAT